MLRTMFLPRGSNLAYFRAVQKMRLPSLKTSVTVKQFGSKPTHTPPSVPLYPSHIPDYDEPVENKRARLLYQSKKRGILECDLLLGRFAERHISELTEQQLDCYDQVVNGGYNEWDIYAWIIGSKPKPEEINESIMKQLHDFAWSSTKEYHS